MKYAILVAIREYAENVKTKGFWVGILLFPIILVVAITVQRFLEKATPTRHFVLVDQTGDFGPVVEEALTVLHAKNVMRELQKYAEKHAIRPKKSELDLETIPAPTLEIGKKMDEMIEKLADRSFEAVKGFLAEGGLKAALAQMKLKEGAPPFEEPRPKFQRVPLPPEVDPNAKPADIVHELKPYLVGDRKIRLEDDKETDLFAAVIIPRDIREQISEFRIPGMETKERGVEYWAVNLADQDLSGELRRGINRRVRLDAYAEYKVDPEVVRKVEDLSAPFTTLDPKKEEGKEEVSIADTIRQWAPIGFVYLLWVAIFTVAQMLLNNTVEEKSNRIIEVLLSSVTPGELMMGKLLGIAAIGLTMTGAWLLTLVGMLQTQRGPEVEWVGAILEVLRSSNLLPAFVVYFLLGYLLYSGIFLAIGSVCNTLKEAQNFMGPVMLVMMVPILTMMFIPRDPNGTLATILSWIPFYTPFIMMNRAAADPPLFDQVGTLITLLATTAVVLWLSGKIFRIGILRTGQPPKIFEIFRWLRGKAV